VYIICFHFLNEISACYFSYAPVEKCILKKSLAYYFNSDVVYFTYFWSLAVKPKFTLCLNASLSCFRRKYQAFHLLVESDVNKRSAHALGFQMSVMAWRLRRIGYSCNYLQEKRLCN